MTKQRLSLWHSAIFAIGMSAAQASAQTPSTGAPSYIVPGYFNLHTGAFIPRQPDSSAAASRTTHTGTFDVTVTISIVSSVPTSQAITCLADFSASDTTADTYDETASAIAVRSGNTATCTLTIPYSWMLASSPTYTSNFNISTYAAAGIPSRTSTQAKFSSTAVPGNGKTTKVAVAVTI